MAHPDAQIPLVDVDAHVARRDPLGRRPERIDASMIGDGQLVQERRAERVRVGDAVVLDVGDIAFRNVVDVAGRADALVVVLEEVSEQVVLGRNACNRRG